MSSTVDLYRHMIYTDDTCVNFLKQKGLLLKQEFCEKIIKVNNEVCGGVLQTRGCQNYHSIRKKIRFSP